MCDADGADRGDGGPLGTGGEGAAPPFRGFGGFGGGPAARAAAAAAAAAAPPANAGENAEPMDEVGPNGTPKRKASDELSDLEPDDEGDPPGDWEGAAGPSDPGFVEEEEEWEEEEEFGDDPDERQDEEMGEGGAAPHAPAPAVYGVEVVTEFVDSLVSENQTAQFEVEQIEAQTVRLGAATRVKEDLDARRANAHAEMQLVVSRATGGGAAAGYLQLRPGADRSVSEFFFRLDQKSMDTVEAAPTGCGDSYCLRLTAARGCKVVDYLRGDPNPKRRRDQGDVSHKRRPVLRLRFLPGCLERRNEHMANGANPAGRGVKLIVGDEEHEITGYRFLRPDDGTATQLLMTIHGRGTGVGLSRTKQMAVDALGDSVADVVAIWPDLDEDARRNVGPDGPYTFGVQVTPTEDDPLVRKGPKSVRLGDKRIVFNSEKWECANCLKWVQDRDGLGQFDPVDRHTHKDHTEFQGERECGYARQDKRRRIPLGQGAAGGRGGGSGGAGGPGRGHRGDTRGADGGGGSGAGGASRAGGRGGGGVMAGAGGRGRYDLPRYAGRAHTSRSAEGGEPGPDAGMRPAGGGGGSGEEPARGGEPGDHQGGDGAAGRGVEDTPERRPASPEGDAGTEEGEVRA